MASASGQTLWLAAPVSYVPVKGQKTLTIARTRPWDVISFKLPVSRCFVEDYASLQAYNYFCLPSGKCNMSLNDRHWRNKNNVSHISMLTVACRPKSTEMYSWRFQVCKLLNIPSWSDKTLQYVTRGLQNTQLSVTESLSNLQKPHSTVLNLSCLHTSGLIPAKSAM